MADALKWLHLSDIHYAYENFKTDRMREQLVRTLSSIPEKLSFIIISGDLTYQGRSYDEKLSAFLNEILNAVHLSKDSLYLVPGNHDLSRSKPRELMLKTIQDAPEYLDFDELTITSLMNAQQSFFDFYSRFLEREYSRGSVHCLFENAAFNLLCLNTAFACGRDNEEGNLKIGASFLLQQLRRVDCDSDKLNIAVGHHAIDCFSQREQEAIISMFEDHSIHLYLCGHTHRSNITISADGTREIPTFVCGANIVDGYANPAFVIESFNPSTPAQVAATFYCWDTTNFQWVLDTQISRAATNGTIVKVIDTLQKVPTVVDDEFARFITGFHERFEKTVDNPISESLIARDVKEKFTNMRCNQSILNQYDRMTLYFPIIETVMSTPGFLNRQDKVTLTNIIISEYSAVFDLFETGGQIIEAMVKNIISGYNNTQAPYSQSRLKLYVKILIYWVIYECDIFDDIKVQ